jgi:pimeloyl-ACP methyl ester carboxylesterase
MLCVHGGAAHAHWFDFIATGFIEDHHVRAIDLRGHGDSAAGEPQDYVYTRYAADLNEAIERLDLRDFLLVGHSMGGMCCLLYAATYPGRVGKLVVIDSTFHMTEDRVSNLNNVGAREGRSYASRDEFVAGFRLRPAGTTAPATVLRHMAEVSSKQTPDGRWRPKFDRNVYAKRVPIYGIPYWEKIKVPALVVRGDRSPRISAETFAEIQKRCPQAELTAVAHSDHHVTLDNSAGFVEAVRRWLQRQARS